VNALANPAVGKYIDEFFCSSYQKVGTFQIVNKQKQGGNVAAYFCAPDGRVLHCVAGPVDANTMLREAKWVVEAAKKAIDESKGDGNKFKAIFRKAHADRLRNEHGLVVEPVLYDYTPQGQGGALTYTDPTGRELAPVLPPPPVQGPDVKLLALAEATNARAARDAAKEVGLGLPAVADGRGGRWALGNQGRVHHLLAAHSMGKIEKLYGSVFEGILGERISTDPVKVVAPFSWRTRKGYVDPVDLEHVAKVKKQLQSKN
jgi:hypothetical protein